MKTEKKSSMSLSSRILAIVLAVLMVGGSATIVITFLAQLFGG